MISVRRLTVMAATLLLFALVTSPLHASMVGTGEILAAEQAHADRAQLLKTLSREDMRRQMERMGVTPELAEERVARMTDEEVAAINERLGELPAGAGTLEVVAIIFLVLVLLDALGVTDIFAFVRPVR
ncbi:hypothetical protein B1C78_09350 [Thioalkalivibrio denitrificans]|uniref:PA2779 family protein n=1 Tax=Thioalkalivibrio denitrificans TaxID=108003 RepID=A0A1V3NGY2_9GAMM|nr:DUF6627 family protein [Thioalkalivibrio denitrificans]OOG24122.1 hypothetical protein B1C78_09350 [Thioalkalivibrio denitrificans]